MECFYCKKEILKGDKKFFYPLERPYVNFWFHREHYDLIKGDMVGYFTEHEKEFTEYVSKHGLRKN